MSFPSPFLHSPHLVCKCAGVSPKLTSGLPLDPVSGSPTSHPPPKHTSRSQVHPTHLLTTPTHLTCKHKYLSRSSSILKLATLLCSVFSQPLIYLLSLFAIPQSKKMPGMVMDKNTGGQPVLPPASTKAKLVGISMAVFAAFGGSVSIHSWFTRLICFCVLILSIVFSQVPLWL